MDVGHAAEERQSLAATLSLTLYVIGEISKGRIVKLK